MQEIVHKLLAQIIIQIIGVMLNYNNWPVG
jgi:hypothetical protein